MTRRASEGGFTLLEILVASMLLAMLITILTMVFNSSSIAWSTGKASVAEMDEVRQKMATASIAADNAMPRVDVNSPQTWGVLVSPWDAKGELRKRGIVKMSDSQVASRIWNFLQLNLDIQKGQTGKGEWVRSSKKKLWGVLKPGSVTTGKGKAKDFVVGVWSLGPDGKENTGDDISTWPDAE